MNEISDEWIAEIQDRWGYAMSRDQKELEALRAEVKRLEAALRSCAARARDSLTMRLDDKQAIEDAVDRAYTGEADRIRFKGAEPPERFPCLSCEERFFVDQLCDAGNEGALCHRCCRREHGHPWDDRYEAVHGQ